MLTVIKNARLVDSEIDRQGSLLLQDERIIATGSIDAFSALEAEAAVIDAQGQTLMPAFVDLHAHFRDPGLTYKEDLLTGAQAALAGGYTAVNLMANTKPVCDTSEKQAAVAKSGSLGLNRHLSGTGDNCQYAGRRINRFQQLPDSVIIR